MENFTNWEEAKSSRIIVRNIHRTKKNAYEENLPTCVKGSSFSLRFLLSWRSSMPFSLSRSSSCFTTSSKEYVGSYGGGGSPELCSRLRLLQDSGAFSTAKGSCGPRETLSKEPPMWLMCPMEALSWFGLGLKRGLYVGKLWMEFVPSSRLMVCSRWLRKGPRCEELPVLLWVKSVCRLPLLFDIFCPLLDDSPCMDNKLRPGTTLKAEGLIRHWK